MYVKAPFADDGEDDFGEVACLRDHEGVTLEQSKELVKETGPDVIGGSLDVGLLFIDWIRNFVLRGLFRFFEEEVDELITVAGEDLRNQEGVSMEEWMR